MRIHRLEARHIFHYNTVNKGLTKIFAVQKMQIAWRKLNSILNPSGAQVYRVIGTLNGKTVRKNFQTRAEAVTSKQQLEIRRLNEDS